MEKIGPESYKLTLNEQRILQAEDEVIQLEDINLIDSIQRIDDAYSYLAEKQVEDSLLHHERIALVYAFTELAIDKITLNGVINAIKDDYPIDFGELSPADIINP